jgi:hypothetical protein
MMSTYEVFVLEDAHYDSEADDSKNVFIEWDDDCISVDPPLTGCSVTDLLELAGWLRGYQPEDTDMSEDE